MYILECADGSYYTGSTKDLERRLSSTKTHTVQIIQKIAYPLSLFVLKNIPELMKHFTVRNKFKDGVIKRKKL